MRLLQDGVVAALAAIGLTAVIFLLVSAIVHPRRRGTIPATAVIETCGEAKTLEYTVRALLRSRYEEGGFSRVVIVDCGLADEPRRVAEALVPQRIRGLPLPKGRTDRFFHLGDSYGRRNDHHGHGPVRRFPE